MKLIFKREFVKIPIMAWIFIAVFALLISLAVIGMVLLSNAHIEDVNGPNNTALAKITIGDILSDARSSVTFASSSLHFGKSTNVSGSYRDVDCDRNRFKAKKFSGVQAIHATNTDADTLVLDIEVWLESGNLEVVILIDGEYYDHVPLNSRQHITLQDISGKTVVVKMAGESAAVSVEVSRQIP